MKALLILAVFCILFLFLTSCSSGYDWYEDYSRAEEEISKLQMELEYKQAEIDELKDIINWLEWEIISLNAKIK